jgi:hypothetical protein
MNRVFRLCCLPLMATCAVCSTTSASVMNYYVTEDTYIDNRSTTANYGNANGLKVFVNSTNPQPCRTLLKLPTEFDAISSDSLLTAKLWVYNYGSTSLTRAIELHPLTTNFTETVATWNTSDGTSSWSGGSYGANHVDVSSPDHDSWYAFDITSMLHGSDRADLVSHGLLLMVYDDFVSPSATTGQNFVSSENSGYSTCHPYFEVTTIPEPSSIILLAIGLSPVAWWRRRKRMAC